jgi:2-methylcitrate dehydratase PrpD
VEGVEVVLPPVGYALVAVPPEGKRRPRTSVDAQFSVYFAAAVALLEGGLTWQSYRRLSDPQVVALMDRVVAREDPSLKGMGARVVVHGRDGEVWATTVPYPLGEPENPLSWEGLAAKFRSLALTVLPPQRVEALLQRVPSLEQEGDMGAFTPLLQGE